MMNYSQNNGDMRRSDNYLIHQNIYSIDNERVQIQQYDEQEMRYQLRIARSRIIPAASNSDPNIIYEQQVEALKRIFKTWRRGNSLISNIQDNTCSI